METKDIKNSDT